MRQFADLIDKTRAGRMGRATASYGTSSSSDPGLWQGSGGPSPLSGTIDPL